MKRTLLWLCLVAACATEKAQRETPPPPVEEAPAPRRRPVVKKPPTVRTPPLPEHLGLDESSRMVLHFLDVGQGSATLLEFPCGAMLVDTGGELNDGFDGVAALKEQLEAFFARRTDLQRTIDLVVLTHPHIDHVRGVPMVLSTFNVLNLVDNGRRGDELVRDALDPWRTRAEQDPAHHRAISNTDEVPFQGLSDDVTDPIKCTPVDPRIRVLSGAYLGDPGWGSRDDRPAFRNENNHSVVVRVDFGKASVLITGDLEEPALRTLVERLRGTRVLDVDVYVVGHHGSANGTTVELVEEMTPRVAVMSMGPSSRHMSWTAYQYGHPREKIVGMLLGGLSAYRRGVEVPVARGQRQFGAEFVDKALYGTGWDGPVDVEAAPDGALAVHTRPPVQTLQ